MSLLGTALDAEMLKNSLASSLSNGYLRLWKLHTGKKIRHLIDLRVMLLEDSLRIDSLIPLKHDNLYSVKKTKTTDQLLALSGFVKKSYNATTTKNQFYIFLCT